MTDSESDLPKERDTLLTRDSTLEVPRGAPTTTYGSDGEMDRSPAVVSVNGSSYVTKKQEPVHKKLGSHSCS
jgi:hypothetical protein